MFELKSGQKRLYVDTRDGVITIKVFNLLDNSHVQVELDAYHANTLAHHLIDKTLYLQRTQDV